MNKSKIKSSVTLIVVLLLIAAYFLHTFLPRSVWNVIGVDRAEVAYIELGGHVDVTAAAETGYPFNVVMGNGIRIDDPAVIASLCDRIDALRVRHLFLTEKRDYGFIKQTEPVYATLVFYDANGCSLGSLDVQNRESIYEYVVYDRDALLLLLEDARNIILEWMKNEAQTAQKAQKFYL